MTLRIIVVAAMTASLLMGCQEANDGSRSSHPPDDLISRLSQAYHERGVPGFRDEMLRIESSQVPVDDAMRMVLDVGESPVTLKEAELTARLRNLARSIENNPGHSEQQWEAMRDALLSYSFGNSPPKRSSVSWRLLTLYGEMAGIEDVESAMAH